MSTSRPGLAGCLSAIRELEQQYGREPGSVALVAVSKKQPVEAIRVAAAAGQRAFGENYLNEALEKQAALADAELEWHFIGAIQSNKTAAIASHFSWVHTVDRVRIAERLSRQRPQELGPLNVLLQVNISGEASKNGVAPEALDDLVRATRELPQLSLQGLMALPAPEPDPEIQRQAFAAVAALGARAGLPHLSMGTSADFAAAIAAGATMIRLGTAVFGPRPDTA